MCIPPTLLLMSQLTCDNGMILDPCNAQANKLGDWDDFNAWLRTEYDAEDLAEFNFDEEEDLDIYNDFRAKRAR